MYLHVIECGLQLTVLARSFLFQAEDGIRDLVRSRGLGDVYKRQAGGAAHLAGVLAAKTQIPVLGVPMPSKHLMGLDLSLIHILRCRRAI